LTPLAYSLSLDPSAFGQLLSEAEALHLAGRLDEAAGAYRGILLVSPTHADALHQLGVVLYQTGDPGAALRMIDQALASNPSHAAALNSRAAVLTALGRGEEALASYDRALHLAPGYVGALVNRGALLTGLDRRAEALASYERALAIEPGNAQAALGAAEELAALDRHVDALAAFDALLEREPGSAAAQFGRGNVLVALDRHAEAEASFAAAVRCQPDFPRAQGNLAGTLMILRRLDAAAAVCDQMLQQHPTDAEGHVRRAMCRLIRGDFARGWPEYEWRWQREEMLGARRDFGVPQWDGRTDLAGKTILLHAEQGLGDVLQFCRYAPLVAARAAVVLEVQGPLVRLLRSLPGRGRIIAEGEALPQLDLHCPLLSLPLAFETTVETIPGSTPYLAAEPEAVAAWRDRLSALAGLHVGLCWSGNARRDKGRAHPTDRRRSMTLAHYAPLADVAGVSFVSLQKGEGGQKGAAVAAELPAPRLAVHDWTDELDDFADTAALVEALDLVITVDTSVAHLAGALGKPVWILNRFDACWRWLTDREDSPWYPTARLFRQPAPRDWDSVIGAVAAALRELVRDSPGRKVEATDGASLDISGRGV
jgi:tetratricopeptide (TPR) repeat protein